MNWQSYKQSLSNLNSKQKGDSFERLTKHYLQSDPKYATKLKSVWLYGEIPSSLFKKLNLPSQDQGIDLIAETNEGEFWAIQSKYHEDEAQSQSWRSLSTFTGLAFGVCKNISFGLVCTTAERFTKTLKDQDNIGFCTGEVWRGLDEDFFESLTQQRKPKKLKAYSPFSHQKRAIRNGHKHYVSEKESRGKMIMPCGTGKSLTAFWIAEKLDAKRIVVAVPSLALIRQTLKVWLRETYAKKWDVDWICVCSDESVGKVSRDDLAVLKQDLGVPAYTDPETIAEWLRKRHSGKVVVFTTYQSGKALAEASKLARRNFDLGVMDEAHKTVGSRDKTFAHLLFDENIKIKKRLFMTATERRYAGKKDEIISMDDYEVYGDTFEMLSFKEALEQDPPVLSDYKIVTMMIGKEEIADLVKRGAFVKPTRGKWDSEVEADTLASLVALRKAVRKFNIKHAVSFHSSIARAEAFRDNQPVFTELFPNMWNVESYHVSGKMPTSKRDRHMRDFENSKRALITNARCLNEGVDIPDIDCVLFADPKKSTIDIVQAVGRALRLSERKKFGYVIVPVIIEDEGNFNESEAFQSILMTLRALASNDERIIDYFRARSQKKRTYTNIQIEVDERISEKIDVKDFTRELELQVWSKLAKLSWRPFEDAREFVRGLGLISNKGWRILFKQGGATNLPSDIPSTPDRVYKNKGWIDWGDWLGTGTIALNKMEYWPFEKARLFVRSLKLKSQHNWHLYYKGELNGFDKKPNLIPASPWRVYKNDGWISMGDWLGTGAIAPQFKKFRSFIEARTFVRKLGIKTYSDWQRYITGNIPELTPLPPDIPNAPHHKYKNQGWQGYGDFLGSGKRNFLDFEDARNFVKKLKFKTVVEWRKFIKSGEKPLYIPSTPERVYKNKGWINFSDWIGSDRIANQNRVYRDFKNAKSFVHKLGLTGQSEWRKYCQGNIASLQSKPDDIPAAPNYIYRNLGWINWGDWLGTNIIASYKIKFRNYVEAKKFVKQLGLKSQKEWRKYKKGSFKEKPILPQDMPKAPEHTYKVKGSWKGWPDFLGYEPKRKKK